MMNAGQVCAALRSAGGDPFKTDALKHAVRLMPSSITYDDARAILRTFDSDPFRIDGLKTLVITGRVRRGLQSVRELLPSLNSDPFKVDAQKALLGSLVAPHCSDVRQLMKLYHADPFRVDGLKHMVASTARASVAYTGDQLYEVLRSLAADPFRLDALKTLVRFFLNHNQHLRASHVPRICEAMDHRDFKKEAFEVLKNACLTAPAPLDLPTETQGSVGGSVFNFGRGTVGSVTCVDTMIVGPDGTKLRGNVRVNGRSMKGPMTLRGIDLAEVDPEYVEMVRRSPTSRVSINGDEYTCDKSGEVFVTRKGKGDVFSGLRGMLGGSSMTIDSNGNISCGSGIHIGGISSSSSSSSSTDEERRRRDAERAARDLERAERDRERAQCQAQRDLAQAQRDLEQAQRDLRREVISVDSDDSDDSSSSSSESSGSGSSSESDSDEEFDLRAFMAKRKNVKTMRRIAESMQAPGYSGAISFKLNKIQYTKLVDGTVLVRDPKTDLLISTYPAPSAKKTKAVGCALEAPTAGGACGFDKDVPASEEDEKDRLAEALRISEMEELKRQLARERQENEQIKRQLAEQKAEPGAMPSPAARPCALEQPDSEPMSVSDCESEHEQDVAEDMECGLCMERPKNTVNVPCGHVCFCDPCRLAAGKTIKTCPVCREPIAQIIKLFGLPSEQ